ncbi:SPASM domain-containing protein [Ktedonosporobacter rubrisoli]|uniref:SPASM domain-containing protein n=1 Tax=Ktedonosporobacter rubrisoli TaxID=2509675 RepID=A0A4P6JWY9_KTERU|nr:SPASM domain-containing protein [Ktedonosporobacter rubrisoli]QBD79922.1 SPASM domain-containing protein [Ktedonosporobacter rubrisoli]
MRIWLDALPDDNIYANECDNECANDCNAPSFQQSMAILPLMDGDVAAVRSRALQQASPLHIQECSPERWLVCNPTGSGQIAVLDAEALALFQRLSSPCTLAQLLREWPEWSGESIEKLLALFYKLGFLKYPGAQIPVPLDNGVKTLTAWLHVTNECNLRCHYCYLQKTHEDMSAETGRKAIEAIFRSALRHQIKHVRLKYAGGEASLHLRNVLALHDYAAQLAHEHDIGFAAVLLSNGVTIPQKTIEQLKARQIDVMISLDGLGIYHDSQRQFANGYGSARYVLRTIERLLASELIPHISVTVSQRNLQGLPALIEYILERDLPFSLNYYRDNECSAHIADLRFADEQIIAAMREVFAHIGDKLPARKLLGNLLDKANMHLPHRRTCGVGQNYLVIDQHGGVAKCQAEITHIVSTIRADDPLQEVREDSSGVQGPPVEEKEGCRTCTWRYWCTGGCPLLTYRATGRYDVKSPNCTIYTALFPEVLLLEARRLLQYKTPVEVSPNKMWAPALP